MGIRTAMRRLGFFLCLVTCSAIASDISGKIVLQKNLNGKRVEPGVYELRGASVAATPSPEKQGAFDHVAVWLENRKTVNAIPATAKIRQIGRRFQPDFLVLPVGSTVEFPNLDPIFHNIFSLSRSETFDLGYYAQGKSRTVTFARPGVVQIYCHIHPGMYAVVIVAPGAWFGTPDAEGLFSFSQVPPGEYRMVVWQRTAGLVRKKLRVPSSGTVHVNLALPEESDE